MPDQRLDALASAFKDDIEALRPEMLVIAVEAISMILLRHAEVVDAVLRFVPEARLGREMAVTAVTQDLEHLVDFMKEHCHDNEDVVAHGRDLAQEVARIFGLPRRRITGRIAMLDVMTQKRGEIFAASLSIPSIRAIIDVFFATDRKSTGLQPPDSIFGAERGELSFGRAQVTIPRDHKMGKMEEPKWWRLEFGHDPAKHVTLHSLTLAEGRAFFQAVDERADHGDGQALVFIHGFNVAFDEALRRTGQLAYDLNFQGAPILYSWPSNGALTDYTQDATNAEWTRPHLVAFLKSLSECTGVRSIHLVAHSMGNRALLNALDRLLVEENQIRFAQTILTAPDVDVDVFRELAERCRTLAERMTLYASKTDKAMLVSRAVNGHPRAGDAESGLIVMDGLDTIDATDIDTSLIGHGYYGDNRTVLSDLFYAIRGLAPGERHGLRQRMLDELPYWVFLR